MKEELITGIIGTSISAVGTATQTNEVLQTISLIITILGALISCIVIPVLNWYKKAKEDGKITKEEINDLSKTLQEGGEKIKKIVDDTKEKGDK